jgi:hypothetical protein
VNEIGSLKGEIVKMKNVKSGGQGDNSNNKVIANELRGLKSELQSLKGEIKSTKKLQNLAWAISNVHLYKHGMVGRHGSYTEEQNLVRDILLSFRGGFGNCLPDDGTIRRDNMISQIHFLTGSKPSIQLEKSSGRYVIY